MLLKIGEIIHIMVRRAFETDLRRHFIGEIMEVGDSAVRVVGYAFVLDKALNQYVRRPDRRIRIFSLTAGKNTINVLHPETVIDKVTYRLSEEKHLVVTDGQHFQLDIDEFGVRA
jgi:hypothetical protein